MKPTGFLKVAMLMNTLALLGSYLGVENARVNAHRRAMLRDSANVSIASVGTIALSVIGIILAAVIGLRVLAALFPTYTSSVASISENFTTADWGETTANDISPIFATVVALVGMIAVVGIVLLVMHFRKTHA